MAKPSAIKSLSQEDKAAILIFGHPGSRKSSMFADHGDLRILMIRSPLDHIPSYLLNSGVEQWVVQNWDEALESQEFIRMEADEHYDWVVLDSISLMQDWLLQGIWDDLILEKPHRAKYRVDQGEYGVNMWRLEQWVRHVVGAQTVNLAITAHPFWADNPFSEDGGIIMLPWIQGKQMPTKISAEMTMVGYMEVRENEDQRWARLHTHGTESFYAKDTFGIVGGNGQMDNPTIAKIHAAIEAVKTGQTQRQQVNGRGRGRGRGQPAPTRGRGRGRVSS